MNDRLSSGLRRIALAVLVAAAALFASANAVAAPPPAVCGCTATGPYTAPATVPARVVAPTVAADGGSPNRQYFVVPGADGHSLSVERGSKAILTIGLDSLNAGWGFSPDSDRFAVIQDVGGVTNVSLYDLPTATRVWSDNEIVGSGGIGFSPGGSYFLWAFGGKQPTTVAVVDAAGHSALSLQLTGLAGWGFSPDGASFLVTTGQTDVNGNSSAGIDLYDLSNGKRVWHTAANGTPRVSVSLAAAFSPHGKYVVAASTSSRADGADTDVSVLTTARGKTVFNTTLTARNAGWGFSSDTADRSFLVAVGDANVPATHLAVVDDETGRTSSVSVPAGKTSWAFSPCGDVLGLARFSNFRGGELDAYDVDAALFSTLDGSRLAQRSFQNLGQFQFMREPAANAVSDLTDGARIVSADDTSIETFAQLAPTLDGRQCNSSGDGLGTLTGVSIAGETTPGGSATGTIRTDGSFAMTVALSSSSPSVTVPASVQVPAGDGIATFPIAVAQGAADAAVTITATAMGEATPGTQVGTLIVLGQCGVSTPATGTDGRLSLRLAGGVDAGATLDATFTAARPGDTIALSSSDAASLAVPATVTAPAHSRQVTVTLRAGSPAADAAATVTATEGKDAVSAAVVVKAIRTPEQVYVLPTHLYSGDSGTGTVLLSSPALPCGSPVALSSESSALHLPASVTVPAGATRVDFAVTSDVVGQTGFVLVHATAGSTTQTGSVELLAHPKLQSLTVDSPVIGGQSTEGAIVLSGPPPPEGLDVTLSSDNPAVSVPSTVHMSQYRSVFEIDTTAVAADTTATITASFEGGAATGTVLVEASAPTPTTGWFAAQSAPIARGALNAVAYVDDTHAFAVGDNGLVEETSDGGSTWAQVDAGATADLYGVAFADSQHGWIVGDGVVLATTDGGATWTTQLTNADDQLDAVAFVDAEHGFAAGDACGDTTPFCGGVVLETSDGGATWTTVNPCGPSFSCSGIASIDVISPTHVWLGGGNGSMLESVDGGSTWVERDPDLNPYENIDSMSFVGDPHCVIVGANGLIAVTDDGGATWDQIDVSTQRFWDTFTSAAAIDASNVVAVGARGGVIRSADGGRTWAEDSHDTENGLNAVAVRGADHGIAVGQNGAILVYRAG
jgi:photosystem II stability/assembly factor-like uncharacterized protein